MVAWAAQAAFFCGVAAAAWLSLDTMAQTVLKMDYYAQHEQWTEVLRAADRLPKGMYSVRCNRYIIEALYHTGRLADEMFRYPQQPGNDLLFTLDKLQDQGAYLQESRVFLDLGQVNLAEQAAYEAFATSDEHPAVLEQLAMIEIVKRRPENARRFLAALARNPFHRRAAQEMLRRLEADPALTDDPRVSRIRENMSARDRIPVVADAAAAEATVEEVLRILLEKNPRNRMAFELLMAHYLVNQKTEKVVANLARLADLSDWRVPRHYQEAIAVQLLSSGRPPSSPGFEPDPEVLRRARDLQRIAERAAGPEEAVRAARQAGLGDSYFFYLAYGISGR